MQRKQVADKKHAINSNLNPLALKSEPEMLRAAPSEKAPLAALQLKDPLGDDKVLRDLTV